MYSRSHTFLRRIGIIGSGPGAMYTAKYLVKHGEGLIDQIDIFEKLRKPFGLVRYGVAPDHGEVREVANEFSQFLRDRGEQVKLYHSTFISGAEEFSKLRSSYDAVVIATGAQHSKRLTFDHLPRNTLSARDFVLWYNGHPEKANLVLPMSPPRHVVIVGHGNVALDAARMLSKSTNELLKIKSDNLLSESAFEWLKMRQEMSGPLSVSIMGRRGYLDAAFTNKEFRELTVMEDAECRIDAEELESDMESLRIKAANNRGKLRGLSIVEKCIDRSDESKKNTIRIRFFKSPVEYIGNPVESLVVEGKNGLSEVIPADMCIESIGFTVNGSEFGLHINPISGGISNDGRGRVVGSPGVYAAGWAKRGPHGVIAANVPCSIDTADSIVEDIKSGSLGFSNSPPLINSFTKVDNLFQLV